MRNWTEGNLTGDYQIKYGDLSYSDYHTWIPEFEIVSATDKAVRIAIPNRVFKIKGNTSFDTIDIWLPKKCITVSQYNTKTKKGCGWAWDTVFQPNIDKAVKEIRARQKKQKKKPNNVVSLEKAAKK